MKRILLSLIAAITLFAGLNESYAQSGGNRLAFGINYGLVKYWGEFTDNQFYWGGDVYLRYNIIPNLSWHVSAGLAQIRYKTDAEARKKYPTYFGSGSTYPGTTTPITDLNSVRVNTFETFLSVNLFASQRVVPFAFGGVGMMNFEPKAGRTGGDGPLPNNAKGVYKKDQLIIPFGIGAELYLTDDLTINVRGTFRYTGIDYLDDLSPKEDPQADAAKDIFATIGLGFSYYIFGENDNDRDGLSNSRERELGTDPNNPDSDGDGLKDGEEVLQYFTNPLKADTDADNLTDYDEIFTHRTSPVKADTDSDGLSDGEEIARKTDPRTADTDGDSLIDGDEVAKYLTDPLVVDTDGDGLSDGEEVSKLNTNPKAKDSDGDGLNDGDEVNTYLTNPAIADSDGDALVDGLEVNTYRTNPMKPDTDGDGLNDGEEVNKYKTDPTKSDTDNDRLTDGQEITRTRTDPTNPDTDGDKIIDGLDDCPLVAGVASNEKGRNGCPAPPKIGTRMDFPDILFVVNTDQFNFDVPTTAQNLTKMLSYINQCEGLQVLIEGHASEEGSKKRNQELSEMRAARIRSWLIENGVDPKKIQGTVGFGSSKPKIKEPTGKALKTISKEELEKIRTQNRRITVVVTKTCG